MSELDLPGRRLNPEERREHDRVYPALEAWCHYLDARGAHDRFEDAERAQAPIKLRHRCTLETNPQHYCPRVVSPGYALMWARANGHGGRPGTGTIVTLSLMVAALDYMNAPRATTFQPMVDDRDRRRRDGYWRLTSEMVARLRRRAYVPVLTGPPGPRPLDRISPAPRVARSALKVLGDGDMTLSLLRHFLQVQPVTALLEVAAREGRPLATRPPGRSPSGAARGALVRTDSVVTSVDAVTAHGQEYADFLGMAPPSRADVARALEAHRKASGVVEPVRQFSAVDAGQRRKVTGWWRIHLAALAVSRDVIDPAELQGEVEHWHRTSPTAGRTEPATDRAPVTHQLPSGFDPSWQHTNEEMCDVYDVPFLGERT